MLQSIGKRNKIAIYLIFLLILSTTTGKFIQNQKNHSSAIDKINVEGLSKAENLNILKELNNIFYNNILVLNKEEITKVISKHNIIQEYTIKKIYPSTINVKIKPTKFIARIYKKEQLLVGANGKLIDNKKSKEKLPFIFGEFSSSDFLIFKKKVEQSKFIFLDFKTFYFFPSNRWDILTNDNILIKLPQDNFLESLNLAYKIIKGNDFKNKKYIDLRIKNHLIIK